MKIALCLSGLTRSISYGWPLMERYIRKPHDCTVFIHTWDIDNGGVRSGKNWLPSISDGRSKETFIKEEINPHKFIIESFDSWNNNNTYASIPHIMYYSIFRANELKKDFEKENDFKFDLVIRARMDLFFENFINPTYISNTIENPNLIYIALHGNIIDKRFITDVFGFGSSYSMDIYSAVWENIAGKPYSYSAPEMALQHQLTSHNITIKWAEEIKYRMMYKWNNHIIELLGALE